MRRALLPFGKLFRTQTPERTVARRPVRRLQLEALEDRTLLSANASGVVTGVAFVDSNQNGTRDPQEFVIPGITMTLSGTTSQGSQVSATAATDANGAFTFQNVQPGTYQLNANTPIFFAPGPVSFSDLSRQDGINVLSGLSVIGGQSVTENAGFNGLAPAFISGRMFLSSTTAADFPFNAGSGTGQLSSRENSAPFLKTPIPTVSGIENGSNTVDLAAFFSDPDITNSTVRFDTSMGPINVQLFDTTAPQTVANFFDYINSGAYTNSIFHRLTTLAQNGLGVLQGGGFTLQTGATTSLPEIPTNPPIPNEFGASNTADTIAMAQLGGNPNSANDEFFFNVVNNATALDVQKFAVFGQLVGPADQAVLNQLAAVTPTTSTPSPFNEIPLLGSPNLANFPANTTASNYEVVQDVAIVSRNEFLTYSVVANSNPGLVSTTLKNEQLTLNYAHGQTGSAVITVQATDTFGASVQASFTVNVATPPPVVTAVTISPNSPTNVTALTANPVGQDASGDTVGFNFQWVQNGTPIPGATLRSLDLTHVTLTAGDLITVRVTPTDNSVVGTTFTSKPVTIAATTPNITLAPPAVTSVAITPNSAANVTTLTATPTSPDGTDVSFTFQWQQNGTDIPGATSQTLSLAGLTVAANDKFTVKVTPSDVTGTGTTFTSNAVTISTINPTTITVPTVTAVSVTPNSATNTTKLTANVTESDPDGDTVTPSFQWQQNGVNIPGATTQTLDLTTQVPAVNVNDFITVVVTPNDGTLNGPPFTSGNVIVKTVNPITVAS
jgi:cyclophilin family peptidyl-prolyl cis-trans isomerase